MRWLVACVSILALCAGLGLETARAKGGPNPVDYVVVSSGGLAAPRRVAISLPDNYDHMSEVFPDEVQSAANMAAARYSLVIHMNWPEEKDESGNVVQSAQIREIEARYDGGSLIYLAFPQHGERSGWFVANPLFAQQLKAGLQDIAPPATGNSLAPGEEAARWPMLAGVVLLLVATTAASARMCGFGAS